MSTICICGVCIPYYALFPIILIVLQSAWEWFRKNVLGLNDEVHYENSRVIHVKSIEQWKELQVKANETKRSVTMLALIPAMVLQKDTTNIFFRLYGKVVVDFTASWCGPCRYIAPIYHELSTRYPCTMFLKVDVDELKQLSRACGVNAMPTFQFFRNGTKCDEMRGADKNGLEQRIQKHYVEVELPEEDKPITEKQSQDDENISGSSELRQRKPHVLTITSEEHWAEVVQENQTSSKALIVIFSAPWSKPCKDMVPVFEALSGKYPSSVFASVDVDELEAVMNEYKVVTLPTFKVFKQGKVVDELTGAIKSALESVIAKHT